MRNLLILYFATFAFSLSALEYNQIELQDSKVISFSSCSKVGQKALKVVTVEGKLITIPREELSVRDFLLAEAIPTTTLPMGANKLDIRENFDPDANNFDMSEEFMTETVNWPSKRNGEWHHSDFKEMPYQHVRKLYEKFIELMK